MGSAISVLILLMPLLFYSYKSGVFPDKKVWETSFFIIESKYYESFLTFFWTLLGKIVPLFLLLIWFFTCRYWWYWAILSPIGMYLFQIVSLFNDEFEFINKLVIDEPIELFYITPFIICLLILLLITRNKIKKHIKLFGLKEEIENKIKTLNKTNI